jgi:pilus assembly protein CpaB
MRAKTLVLLFVALGCGMIAAVAVSKAVMDKGVTQPAEAMVEIFVAVNDLPHAEKISAEKVKLEKWPKSRLPEGALFNLNQLENKFTKQNIFAGEPILERKISDSRESFSTSVPPGFRIFDIACNASYIKAGDHVDILGTFRPGGRNSIPQSRTVMRNVKVHGINGSTTRDSDESDKSKAVNKATVFQLLVKESQVEALTLANSLGELQLNLRPFGEDRSDREDNGEEFLSWVNEAESAGQQSEPAPTPGLFSQLAMHAPRIETPKQSMVIITPEGARRYEWSNSDELPQQVVENPQKAGSTMPANTYAAPSGNVYSGYGGYSPTYPTSVNPSAPAPDGAVKQDPEAEEAKIN